MKYPTKSIVDICKVSTGKRDANHASITGKYPFFTCADKPLKADTFAFTGECIILPGNGANVGLVLFYNGDFEAYQRTYVLNNFNPKVYPRYVFYNLLKDWRIKNSKSQYGSATNYIRMQNFEDYEIPLPPLAEQKHIAAILDKADAIRRKRQQAIKLTDDFLRATFLDMFGDPVTNPKGWDVVSYKSICERITVGIVVRPASYYRDSGIPALRSLNIRANQVTTENLVYFSQDDNETKLAKTRVWKDDLLLVRSGQPGTAAVVPSELDGVNAIDLLISTPDKSKVDPSYLCFYFNSERGKQMVLGEQRGQIQKHLNVGSLNVAPILLPPVQLQREFSKRVQKTQNITGRLKVGNVGFENLFNSLTQRAFRGEL